MLPHHLSAGIGSRKVTALETFRATMADCTESRSFFGLLFFCFVLFFIFLTLQPWRWAKSWAHFLAANPSKFTSIVPLPDQHSPSSAQVVVQATKASSLKAKRAVLFVLI